MGPVGSPMSQIGVQLTDSPYVVVNMRIMARIGLPVLAEIDKDEKRVVPCMHSVGAPLAPGQKDVPWPCNDDKYIVHFPETREIWCYGSGYGGNALLGKKCFALRIASNIARDEGWMAEHMLILGVEIPQGEKTYVAAAFPSACGKTNFAMLVPPDGVRGLEGLDRRRRHRLDQAGRERPVCAPSIPRRASSAWRRAPATRPIPTPWPRWRKNTIFTNVALTPEGGVWWEGMTDEPPAECLDWQGKRWTPEIAKETGAKAAHPNARFTAPAVAVPDDRSGLGRSRRRADQRHHLRRPPRDHHAAGLPGLQLERRRLHRAPPWARRPRPRPPARSARCAAIPWPCCPSAAITWATTSGTGSRCSARSASTPRIFHVNWFRKDADGKFLWPGFSENMRVLKWIVDRAHGRAHGQGDADRLDAALRRHRVDRARLPARAVRRAAGSSTAPRGATRSSATRSSSSICTTTCRRR